jgi:hypothetical protein
VERVLASGQAWVSVASYEGHKDIRACVTNGETAKEDVDALVLALDDAFYAVIETASFKASSREIGTFDGWYYTKYSATIKAIRHRKNQWLSHNKKRLPLWEH